MISCFTGMRGNLALSRWRGLFCALVIGLSLPNAWMLVGQPSLASAGEGESAKEAIIRGILADFQLILFIEPKMRGQTFHVVIKDFSLNDRETYAIIDSLKEFYVIYIPLKERNPVCGTACSKSFRLSKVRKDLVALTRAKGLRWQFTIPTRKEDLPPPS